MPLERLGAAGGLRAEHEALARELSREEIVVEVVGARATAVLETLIGVELFAAPDAAAPLPIRARAADRLVYRARFADGGVETLPPDHSAELAAAVSAVERDIATVMEEVRELGERLQDRGRVAVRARAQLAASEQERALRRVQATPQTSAPPPAPPPVTATQPAPHTGLWAWLLRLIASLIALFSPSRRRLKQVPARAAPPTVAGNGTPPPPTRPPLALPPIERQRPTRDWVEPTTVGNRDEEPGAEGSPALQLAAAERRVDDDTRLVAMVDRERERLEDVLRVSKARATELNAERERRRSALEAYRSDLRSRNIARLRELTRADGPRPVELEVGAPELPAGVLLVLAVDGKPPPLAVDARLVVAPATAGPRGAPSAFVEDPRAREAIVDRIEALRRAHPTVGARRLERALRDLREIIGAKERSTRQACDARRAELEACRVVDREAMLRERRALAQHAVAKTADEIVQKAADALEELIGAVRHDWEAQIAACASLEQVRAQVTAIETAAPHRLSIVCDDVRESMLLQFVRLVLELMQPLRQELLRMRIAVAEGRSPKADETFQSIRAALPAQVDATFGALRAPELGALAGAERGILRSLFHTVAREKRQHLGRLAARLDDMKRATVRELFASAVFLSPLLLATCEGLAEELLWAHERWVADRVGEAETARQEAMQRIAPALELVPGLEESAARLGERLVSFAAALPG